MEPKTRKLIAQIRKDILEDMCLRPHARISPEYANIKDVIVGLRQEAIDELRQEAYRFFIREPGQDFPLDDQYESYGDLPDPSNFYYEIEKVREELRQELVNELAKLPQVRVCQKITAELRQELLDEITAEPTHAVYSALRGEILDELNKEHLDTLRQEIVDEIRDELEEEFIEDINDELPEGQQFTGSDENYSGHLCEGGIPVAVPGITTGVFYPDGTHKNLFLPMHQKIRQWLVNP